MPGWSSLHPLVVHFPIALLLIAPVLALVGLLIKQQRAFLFAALLLMAIGTASAWLAVGTGEAAGELAGRGPGVERVLERHSEMAETSRTLFTLLTLVFAALLLAPVALKRPLPRLAEIGGHGAFLALYAVAAIFLGRTAHQGGLLVHQYGVHALQLSGAPAAPQAQGETESESEEARDDDRD
jgi:uncharacterized membrane protein